VSENVLSRAKVAPKEQILRHQEPNEKLDRIDFEDIGELFQHVDRGRMFLPLASIPT
jgi:hypothetical protein